MAKLKVKYAIALFELSETANTLKKDLDDAIWIRDSLSHNDIQVFLKNPGIADSEKNQLFSNNFSDKITKHMMGFLYLMVRKNHESFIVDALTQYIDLVNRHFGRIKAKVVSARPLTDIQIDSITDVLSKKMDMEVEIETEIDPDHIGGYYILVNGKILDNSIRSQVNKMKKRFYKGISIARVVSAKALSEEEIQTIRDMISRKLNTEVKVNGVVDPDLLGGFYIVVDGHYYDGTVRSKLKDMKKSIKRGKFEW
ncbi:MAG: ATP synthase F1 subunit delta [Clostridiales bacterium]|nr:ATP synthase F1 subunit delta [Clostridiales bacterium]